MNRCFLRWSLLAVSLLPLIATPNATAQGPDVRIALEDALHRSKLSEAARLLGDTLSAKPEDDQARFALGVVQFLRAVEGRMQALFRHGFHNDPLGVFSFSNLPIAQNSKSEPLDYRTARRLLQAWVDDLGRVEATLKQVKSPDVKLPLHLGLIRMDFNGDGKAEEDETLWKVYARFNQGASIPPEAAKTFVIGFDRGDVDWLRGYCHVLSALAEVLLAHDFEEVFDRTGYLLFDGVIPPESFLLESRPQRDRFDSNLILDLVAMIHLIRLPVAEPARLKSALAHMESMVTLSRSSWKFILAETDDDQEWVPNPKQNSVVPSGRVTAEMVDGWQRFLDEFESILQGRKLAPFWRGNNPRRGINVRRVLTEPRPLDLVLWVQGSAAAPYLEEGDVSSTETWSRFNRIFRGEFIGFAIWFN